MQLKLAPMAFVSFIVCAMIPSGGAGVVLGFGWVDTESLGEGVHFVGPLAEVETIAASLTTPMLEFDRIQELNRLAASSNAKTVVIGPGAGGTPVLLSTPTATSR